MERDQSYRRFDVAIWEQWPPAGDAFPVIGMVTAWDAAEAVTAVMRAYGLQAAGHVAAAEVGRRFVHRANDVVLWEEGSFVHRASNG